MPVPARADTVGIGLLGMGVVGSAVAAAVIAGAGRPAGTPLEILGAVVRDPSHKRPVDLPPSLISTDAESVLSNDRVKIVVEVMGGESPAFDYMATALSRGKHVVTANKEVMSKRGDELLSLASTYGVRILYEASVGGGIPVLGVISEDLLANDIRSIRAIINGTTNYILTRMAHEGVDFDEVLAEAQRLGYAEADPTADVDGFDALFKISILSRLAFRTAAPLDCVHREGIRRIGARDFRYASELGYTIKLLAAAQRTPVGLLTRVHPALIPAEVPMAGVNGVLNAVEIEGDLVGPLWLEGQGAGPKPTASAVLGDVIRIAREVRSGGVEVKPEPSAAPLPIAPMQSYECQYYMRLTARDRAGVLAQIASVLGDAGISINSVLQKDTDARRGVADLVIMTHPAREANMQEAASRVRDLDVVAELDNLIRVESYPDQA